ncbi:MAG: hypothetical protein K2R98_12125 [Gemmataceae bacterium]|nr:hypothetical protein [Gemmataceae bacterium]
MATLTGKRACPFCGKRIQATSHKCMYCGAFLEAAEGRSIEFPSDELHARKGNWWLPADQSRWAVAAGYLGVLALVPYLGLAFGLLAVMCGVMALRDLNRHPALRGQGRAYLGLVLGGLGSLYNVFVLAAVVLPHFVGRHGPAPRI